MTLIFLLFTDDSTKPHEVNVQLKSNNTQTGI